MGHLVLPGHKLMKTCFLMSWLSCIPVSLKSLPLAHWHESEIKIDWFYVTVSAMVSYNVIIGDTVTKIVVRIGGNRK